MRTPKHNGTAERRNELVTKVARAMLAKNDVSNIFWREAMNTTVYTMNRVQFRKDTNKTPYEHEYGHSPIVKYFNFFCRKCYLKRDDDVSKFDAKSD